MSRMKVGGFVAGGLLVALLLAFFVSPSASTKPDGLNKVAADTHIASAPTSHALDDSPTAGYQVKGVDDGRLSRGLAGVIGVGITFAFGAGMFWMIRRRRVEPVDEPT